MNRDDELTSEEAAALERLAQGPLPPAGLEEKTLARLAAHGLFERRRAIPKALRPWAKGLLAAAAAGLIFIAGVRVGAGPGPAPAAPDAGRYVLLLYQSPAEVGLAQDVEAARVAEYTGWARGLREQGRDVTGEKLTPTRSLLQPPAATAVDAGSLPIDGFFIVSAQTLDEAIGVARTCPHLKYGGTIEVRPVEGT